MGRSEVLEAGRQAVARGEWKRAHAALTEADRAEVLALDDVDRLATCAYLLGREPEAAALWRRAHHALVDAGDLPGAARRGFWLSLTCLLGGEPVQAAGWLARVHRLLEDVAPCAEHGYAGAVEGLLALGKGDAAAATARFDEALALARREGEPDLLALALLGGGQSRIQSGAAAAGVASLDEAMVAITSERPSPIVTGIVYCGVILTCQRVFDFRRSMEWTRALDRWCEEQPELVAFRGQCMVHRSEVLQLEGEWQSAVEEARRACAWSKERAGASGRALYQLAELHRLRGELEDAERVYREASRAGKEPQPGVSLLRLAEGKVDVASAAIRRVVDELAERHAPGAATTRVAVLGPYVEIMLTAGDTAAARRGANALAAITADADLPYLRGVAKHADGAVRLAEGDAKGALATLREAWDAWKQLDAPYEAARVRVAIADACRVLGDADTAAYHLDAAIATFESLGAKSELGRLVATSGSATPQAAPALTTREKEVLAMLAAGRTNRQIGKALFISEHTVARHVSNIFDKLDVSSRSAAAAFAVEHGLA